MDDGWALQTLALQAPRDMGIELEGLLVVQIWAVPREVIYCCLDTLSLHDGC